MNLWEQLERGELARGDAAPRGWRFHAARVALALVVALATYALFPRSGSGRFEPLSVGSVAPENVIAPFGFTVPAPAAELARARQDAARAVAPVYVEAAGQRTAIVQRLRALGDALTRAGGTPTGVAAAAGAAGLSLTAEQAALLAPMDRRRAVLAAIRRVATDVASGALLVSAADAPTDTITLIVGGVERPFSPDSVHVVGAVIHGVAATAMPGDPAGASLLSAVLESSLRPTLIPDASETDRRRVAVGRAVRGVRYQVQAGEKIVGAHEVVSSEQYEKLRALRAAWSPPTVGASAARIAGALLYDLLVILALGIAIAMFRPLIYRNWRAMLLVAGALLLTMVAAAIVARVEPLRPELVPVAFAALVFGVVFDARISVVAALLIAILVGGQPPFRDTSVLFLSLIGGVAAAFATRLVRRRNDAFYPIAIIASAYAVGAITVALSAGWDLPAVLRAAGWGLANAVACVSLALMLMPAAEEFTGIDTYPKLLEWSDLNRPLLRRLSIEAPGTYNHTVQIANLAEAACTAIGADGLLARVGAYYHDIGKLRKPQYFVENQQGRNPHDKLKPSTSASIIRNHVREGLELAEEAGVPASVRAFIAEHHGTGPISYFLDRAQEREGPGVNPADFAYPGPVPQTAERAVCMLADGVEAATRALADPTPQAIREVVDRIVRQRMDQGQLRDAPLTLRQLEIVKDQFVRMLVASHHQRVDYPVEGRFSGSMPAIQTGPA